MCAHTGAADALVDALEVAAGEVERQQAFRKTARPGEVIQPNLLMMGLSPAAYVMKTVGDSET